MKRFGYILLILILQTVTTGAELKDKRLPSERTRDGGVVQSNQASVPIEIYGLNLSPAQIREIDRLDSAFRIRIQENCSATNLSEILQRRNTQSSSFGMELYNRYINSFRALCGGN